MVAAVRDARHEEAGADRRPAFACRLRAHRLAARRLPAHEPARRRARRRERRRRGRGRACAASPSGPPAGSAPSASPPRRAGTASARALTEAAIARLHERGADTVLLFATDMGRPLYERLGFVHRGRRHRVARHRRRDPAPACRSAACARTTAAPSRDARPRGHRRGPRRTCSTRCTRWRAWPPSARGDARRLGGQGALRRRHRDLRRRRRGRRRADGRRRERPGPGDARRARRQRGGHGQPAPLGLPRRQRRRAHAPRVRRSPGDRSVSSGCSTCSGGRGAGASVPQPDPDLRGRAGDPCGFPVGQGVPWRIVRIRTFLNPVHLAPGRDRNQVPVRSSKWRATVAASTGSTRLSRMRSSTSGKPLARRAAAAASTSYSVRRSSGSPSATSSQ